MLNKKNIDKFEHDLMESFKFLCRSSEKEIKLRDRNSKSYEFKGTPKEFIKYVDEKY